MSYTYPGQMFDHTLVCLKGAWPNEYAVDISGTLSSSINIGSVGDPVNAGVCLHVSDVTAVTDGPPEAIFSMGANLTKMPCWLWSGSTDFDVSNPGVPAGVGLGGTTTNKPAHIPIFPTGRVVALVACGGYELESTEFDTSLTYSPNDALRAVTRDTSADAGKLTKYAATASSGAGQELAASSSALTVYTDTVVAITSRGKYTNANGVSVLAFWPWFLPGTR